MSPLQLLFALTFYYSGDPTAELGEKYDSLAGQEAKEWLLHEGLIEDGTGHPTQWGRPTERLAVFIKHLCAQPLPVQTWVMPSEIANG